MSLRSPRARTGSCACRTGCWCRRGEGQRPQPPARGTARLRDVLHLVGEVAARCWRRERLAILVVKRDCFLYDLAQLLEDGFFVCTVAPPVNEARRTPDKALVFLRPLDNLRVPCTFLHDFDSFLVILSEAKNLLLAVQTLIARR